ncbi:pyruvate, phosphate dikinase [Clostridium sp. PL3]|uniref:Pyruvate, phosphate dikinase n=1 Tax=Clostridium thailandense TaxID=2794346 RepID=A0A949WVA6_9CLOT|nr:PEP/pyruvate-binding domain-containing protein [Clostridium thailandense]MBV7273472.1 pyruvate, phosphate dikinase [Clostridium thailandense]
MSNYTKMLSELNKDSLPQAGGKGANLGVLINAGLPVPQGFVVTTGAYRAHLEASGLKERIEKRIENIGKQDIDNMSEASKCISAWIEEAPMPVMVQEELNTTFESFFKQMSSGGKLLLAVRSSATAEDLPSASFAGQHETFLGVYGKEDVFKHVKKCWASLWSSQAISYRVSMGFDHLKVDLAVVVQAMIDSEVAGVMFTANPVNGSRDEILISAAYGLGEAVVSGLVTPDTFVLTKDGRIKEKSLGSKKLRINLMEKGTTTKAVSKEKQKSYCLGENELTHLIKLANLVEKHYGSPQDTEWALSQGKIYMLQARPITTDIADNEDLNILGPNDKIIYQGKKAPSGLQSVMEHCSEPPTPLDFAYINYSYQGVNTFFHDIGFKLPKDQNRPVERENGCVAISYHDSSLSPVILWKLPKYLIKCASKESKDLWKPVSEEMIAWIERIDKESRNTNDLVKYAKLMEQAMKEFSKLFYKRFASTLIPGSISVLKFEHLVKKTVRKENADQFNESLMRALPFRTALQNDAIVKVAQAAAVYGKESKIFKEEFDKFIEEYGDRPSVSMGPMVGSPTWREKPESVYKLIDALLCDTDLLDSEKNFKKQEDDYEAAKKQIKELMKLSKYRKFLKALEKARNAVIVREESLFFLEKLVACLRRLASKFGKLLVKKSLINEAEDVFFIFLEEVGSVAEGKLGIKEKIEKRKKAFSKVYAAHEKGVHWMISTGSIPKFEMKNKNKMDIENDPNSIQGSPASRGVYEGPVCIVRNPSEFNKLKKGDILVSPYTAPVWTPLFKVAAAAVTEIGSAGSHAAIVSREYGIPCVVAIDNITNILKDGQKIRVDGTKGIITLL